MNPRWGFILVDKDFLVYQICIKLGESKRISRIIYCIILRVWLLMARDYLWRMITYGTRQFQDCMWTPVSGFHYSNFVFQCCYDTFVIFFIRIWKRMKMPMLREILHERLSSFHVLPHFLAYLSSMCRYELVSISGVKFGTRIKILWDSKIEGSFGNFTCNGTQIVCIFMAFFACQWRNFLVVTGT